MATKMSGESKLIAWELGWVKREPIDRIRSHAKVRTRLEKPSWRTVRKIMTEFLVLDEGQAQMLTEPLEETWRRWKTHIERLRKCAERLKRDLVFEETDISVSTMFVPIFPTSFGDDDSSEGVHKKGLLSWKVEGESIDVNFSVESLPSFNSS